MDSRSSNIFEAESTSPRYRVIEKNGERLARIPDNIWSPGLNQYVSTPPTLKEGRIQAVRYIWVST